VAAEAADLVAMVRRHHHWLVLVAGARTLSVGPFICLRVTDAAGTVFPPALLTRSMLHELAHCLTVHEPGRPHGPRWRRTMQILQDVAVAVGVDTTEDVPVPGTFCAAAPAGSVT
jgi:hypothetical protein